LWAITRSRGRRHALYWAHQTSPRALPIQRLAELVGLASLSPSHLSIHPLYGPWFALRAVAVFDVDGPDEPAPALTSPCVQCDKPCLPALERALPLRVEEHAGAWIAVRDACPVGRASRYGEEQLRYHYTKDRKLLR
jgi:methylmalonic aciduria homocystinuria type C protein